MGDFRIRGDVDAKAVEIWYRGHCYPMAMALSERLGCPVACLVVDLLDRDGEFNPHVVHAWARTEEGPFDARGRIDEDEVVRDLLDNAGSRVFRERRVLEYPDAAAFLEGMETLHSHRFDWAHYRTSMLPDLLEKARSIAAEHLLEPSAPAMSP